MKILFVHSYYQQKGGEDSVFEQEYALLKQTLDTRIVEFRNQRGLKGIFQFLFSVWNPVAAQRVRRAIRKFKPDIVQIYNWHYAAGPIIIREAKRLGILTVLNVQNYRLLCPSGTLLKKGKLFTASIEKRGFPWYAVKNKVFRNSGFQTFWLGFVVWFHKQAGTWKKVDKYIVPTQTVMGLFTNSVNNLGISEDKFVIKPNFSVQEGLSVYKRENHFLFVGRLSEEKGIRVLLDAFQHQSHELIIAGSGPLKDEVIRVCTLNSNIRYVGNLDKPAIKEAMSRCNALIFTSVWYEPFGLVITEALSNGCPLIASDIGSPLELVQEGITGMHFRTGDVISLQNKINEWQSLDEGMKEQYRLNCISVYNKLYTPEKNKEQLLSIYQSLISFSSGRKIQ